MGAKNPQEYFRTVIRREIMERFNLKHDELLKTVAKLLLNSTHFPLRHQLTRPQKAFFANNGRPEELIQICFDLTDRETQKREFGALMRTGKKLGCNNLQIITASDREKISFPAPIQAVSLEDFFLFNE